MKITLEDALPVVRWLETQLIPKGAHCSLGGSVLHKGFSEKDLDIFIYPHNEPSKGKKDASFLVKIILDIFPSARLITDVNYPHDRLLYRSDNYYGIRIELFIFV